MLAEDFLRQYEKSKIKIKNIEREIEDMISDSVPIKSTTDYDGMPHGNNIGDPTSAIAIAISDKLKQRRYELACQRLEAVQIREKVFNAVMMLDGTEQESLYAKYVLLLPEAEICDYIGYERTMMYEYVSRGVKEIQNLLNSGRIRT